MANKNLKLTLAALFGGVAAVTTATALTLTSCNPEEKGLKLHDVKNVEATAGTALAADAFAPSTFLDGKKLELQTGDSLVYSLEQKNGDAFGAITAEAFNTLTGLSFDINTGKITGTSTLAASLAETTFKLKVVYTPKDAEPAQAQTADAQFTLKVTVVVA
ncbi:MAG: hypothetical protein LBC44_01195 [Mycoplasmataceae bacterium]|nr:hypothetical protein [Mycoplasmataceae bacterium]